MVVGDGGVSLWTRRRIRKYGKILKKKNSARGRSAFVTRRRDANSERFLAANATEKENNTTLSRSGEKIHTNDVYCTRRQTECHARKKKNHLFLFFFCSFSKGCVYDRVRVDRYVSCLRGKNLTLSRPLRRVNIRRDGGDDELQSGH